MLQRNIETTTRKTSAQLNPASLLGCSLNPRCECPQAFAFAGSSPAPNACRCPCALFLTARRRTSAQSKNYPSPAHRQHRAAGKRDAPMPFIRLLGLNRPAFCKLQAGFAESVRWLKKGPLRMGHPFRPPGTSRVKMPFVLVYSPPIDGKCRHALSIFRFGAQFSGESATREDVRHRSVTRRLC
jgi:hypothetical protein